MFIKDVKSSNGTFINGERLSSEAQESDVFELHNEDLVEFGIDIVGDDNKTIIHHKVACRVYLVLTAEDALGIRHDFANMYRGNANSGPNGPMGGAAMGPGAEGGLRRGKSSISFDHVLGRLQMEVQKSRETGSEIGSLNNMIGEIQESFGGGAVPPMQEPPFQHMVPPPRQNAEEGNSTGGDGKADAAGPSSQAVAALQAQLAEAQSSINNQVDKIRALESMLAEHEVIKAEVGSIKTQMEEAKRELDEMANARKMALPSGGVAPTLSQLKSRDVVINGKGPDDDEFDDGASMASMDTVIQGADVGNAPKGADEVESAALEAQEEDDGHVGPRAPPDLPPELAARDAAAAAAVAESGASNAAKSASNLEAQAEAQLQAQNKALSVRLEALESQLEEALSFGKTLQSQHVLATETVKALEEKVQFLEQEVQRNLESVQGKITEALEGRFSQWKEQIEEGWKREKQDWEEERERLRRVVEAWDQANGKLEEQAAHQIALGEAASARSPTGESSNSSHAPANVGGRPSTPSRRRASKSAKRRAAKRHLNPSLRALLYKSSHNGALESEDFENSSMLSSDDEDGRHSSGRSRELGIGAGGGTGGGGGDGLSSSSASSGSRSGPAGSESAASGGVGMSGSSTLTTPEGSDAGGGEGSGSGGGLFGSSQHGPFWKGGGGSDGSHFDAQKYLEVSTVHMRARSHSARARKALVLDKRQILTRRSIGHILLSLQTNKIPALSALAVLVAFGAWVAIGKESK